MQTTTIGGYLAARLTQVGLGDYFAVPGDFNLILLDEFLKEPGLRMVSCCNELNAGYAADGYARLHGFAAVAVTYMVGGTSLINATAGAYSEDLPLLVISGGPNTNDTKLGHVIHHTIGEVPFNQSEKCFAPVVAGTFIVNRVEEAAALIDRALLRAFQAKKPVYLEIACNLANQLISVPTPMEWPPTPQASDPLALAAAVQAIQRRLGEAVKPVLVVGVKARAVAQGKGLVHLADQLGCAVAVMPNAKGLYPELHPAFMGTYWGTVSSPHCQAVVESSDCQIFLGPTFNDYSTVGWSAVIKTGQGILVDPEKVTVGGTVFNGVILSDLVAALVAMPMLACPFSLKEFNRINRPTVEEVPVVSDDALQLFQLRHQIQGMLDSSTELVVETGDSWFNGQLMDLPEGCGYHFQMQYGSIGWATPASLGLAMAAGPTRRILTLTGDGSLQMTAQEVSTMIRYQQRIIIFVLNNRGYTIEVEIHDGPYNNIQNWNYAALMEVFSTEQSRGLGLKARTSRELEGAIDQARSFAGPVLIECVLDRDDCSQELLAWGSAVAQANGRL